MSRDWEKTLPKFLRDYIESERQAARVAGITEERFRIQSEGDAEQSVTISASSAPQRADVQATSAPVVQPSKLDRKDNSTLPRGVGRKYVAEYWREVAPTEILSVTQVRQRIFEKTGLKISFQTVNRAMEQLGKDGDIENIEGTEGWRAKPKLRSVK